MTPERVWPVATENPWFRRDFGRGEDPEPEHHTNDDHRPNDDHRTNGDKVEPDPAPTDRGVDPDGPLVDESFIDDKPAQDRGVGKPTDQDSVGVLRAAPDADAADGVSGRSAAPDSSVPATALGIVGRATIGEVSLDAAALREVMALADPVSEPISSMFYANVFWRRPELRELFPAGMAQQRGRLYGALVTIIGSLGDQEDPSAYLKALGRDHRKFGVVTEHYDVIGAALFDALGTMLGDEWTPRRQKAWNEAYDVISRVMIGAADDDATRAPAWWDAEVVLHHRLGADMAIIQVKPHTDYPFQPGQYCSLMTPRRDRMWRSYSIANRPRNDNILEFHVKAEEAGWVSSALVWRTEVGDVFRLGAPQGRDITARREGRDILMKI